MSKNERIHFINDYLCVIDGIERNELHVLTENELISALQGLISYDKPDMYAVVDDKIVLLEHFAFHASKRTSKGMKGIEREVTIQREIESLDLGSDNIWKPDTAISLQNWQDNFEKVFWSHYQKIDGYKKNVAKEINVKGKRFVTGFLIENEYPPYVMVGRQLWELCYAKTKQFVDTFLRAPDVDFILFAGYGNKRKHVVYMDQIEAQKNVDTIDLTDPEVQLSPLNKNEVVWGATYVVADESCEDTEE